MERKFSLLQLLVFTGGLLGLLAGIVIGLRRFGIALLFADAPASGPEPPSGDALSGQIAFFLAFTAPFLLSLAVLFSKRTSLQAVVWLGSGLLGVVGAFFSFSIMTRILLPLPALLVLSGGVIAFTRQEVKKSVLVIVLALVMVFAGVTSFITLFTQENPACWALVRTEGGKDVWEPSLPSLNPPIIAAEPGTGDTLAWSCSSDVISRTEGLYSLAIWAAVAGGLALAARLEVLD
ncbi:MAG TPA: hypothetical protein VMN57_12025 [Anaerolineales bacterium]|nr:hypothetical protein [Anaerolineales bacterium]